MAQRLQYNYYSNPAFSQQSEFYNGVPISPNSQKIPRRSPVGAQTPLKYYDISPRKHEEEPINEDDSYDEQEFYEEMLVDDSGIIKEKKVVVVSSPGASSSNNNNPENPANKSRYEYIQMQEQSGRYIVCHQQKKPSPSKTHRYEIIETATDQMVVPASYRRSANNHRYEYIPDEEYSPKRPSQQQQHRYEYIQSSPPTRVVRSPSQRQQQQLPAGQQQQPHFSGNPIATQKLHELLSTPKKQTPRTNHQATAAGPVFSPQSQRRRMSSSPAAQHDPFVTPKKPLQRLPPPPQQQQKSRAQQKLNYALGTRQMAQDKRYTAVVAPMCSSPIQSVYSETTFSQSWMNLAPKKPIQVTLALAAVILTSCGSVTSGLCFYMISIMGRQYFLDFGVVAGFTCLVLGLLGFRTRRCLWLPNRNYISGYIVLSLFSLMMCIGLVVLMLLQPKPGTPLADMTSGAVCGISVLSILLASVGVISSYCCKYPPPDNRVEHSVPGFTV